MWLGSSDSRVSFDPATVGTVSMCACMRRNMINVGDGIGRTEMRRR